MSTSKRQLHIDIETYSEVDLRKCGAYRYASDLSFEVLLLAYAYNDEDVQIVDLAQGESLPAELLRDLTSGDVIKLAHNANFERTCLAAALGVSMPPEQWVCTAVRAATLGLPHSLANIGAALKLKAEDKKMSEGKRLITYFCKPCKPTKTNGGRTRNLPPHEPERWELFKQYCGQDVVTERKINSILEHYPDTKGSEKELWNLDQKINDGGVLVEKNIAYNIIDYSDQHRVKLIERATEISGLDNPNSLVQIKGWLKERGLEVDTLNKDDVKRLINELGDKEPEIVEFLKIRQGLGKTSVAKYDAMARALCPDDRIRGMLQFYGASRTGRWAGRIVQLQNLPQNKFKDLDLARRLVLDKDFELLELLYPSIMEVFSQLIRTCFITREGKTFIVADYSAIEARVIAWLASEKWRLDVFNSHGKIYEASAAQMFKIPIDSITHDSPERAKGKVAELALGYQGSVGALTQMGGLEMGLDEPEMERLVAQWRASNPRIVALWKKAEASARLAILNPGSVVPLVKGVKYKMIDGVLFARLPSGRHIAYYGAEVRKNGYRDEIFYMGQNQTTNKWELTQNYGGKLVENLTQAIARDCLGSAMLELDKAGYTPRFHVHDEVVIEVDKETAQTDMAKICDIMTLKGKSWVKGLPLTADAYQTDYYIKD